MSEGYSQCDVTEINFETSYLPYHEVKYKIDPEIQLKTFKNCQKQMKILYQKLMNNTKRIVSKLCYKIGKFSPFDPIIKQSFQDISNLQKQWSQYNKQNLDKYSSSFDELSHFIDETKRQQQIDLKNLKKSKIKVASSVKKQNTLKTTFIPEQKPFSIFSNFNYTSENEESIQSLSLYEQNNVTPYNRSQYKYRLKDQFYHIKQFVFFQLHPKLTLHYDKILLKKVVLNSYILWNRKIDRELKITQMAKLQMELTVQIKQKFPSLDTKRKFFKGIGFKDQFVSEMNLTDRRPIVREFNIPFDAESRINPINQIIKLARLNEKSEIQKAYTEDQLRALDEALGLI